MKLTPERKAEIQEALTAATTKGQVPGWHQDVIEGTRQCLDAIPELLVCIEELEGEELEKRKNDHPNK